MSATSGGGGSVSEGSDAGGSSQSTMSVNDSPSTSFQANLVTENVTKITLSDENSTGGYAAEMTGSKINLTLDERQHKDGIVNVAFDYEEGANRGGSGGGSGEFRSMNGSEKKDKVPEAVNLELVNMVPYSNGNSTSYGMPVNGIPGIPMKKDSEQVDMSTPYDEYFVPVNEHKKYMRGEKLYVTKDKRRPTNWRRCFSWIVACTVISVVLVVAILAGTGVILSQEPDLVKDASVGRNFAGSNLKPSVTDKSFTATAEKLMFVPRSIESEFVIDNLDFDPALRDLNSTAYQQFTSSLEDHLKMLLFDKETLEFGASNIGVKIVNISRDPFKINYRIGWNYKQGVNNPPEPIKMEDVKRKMVESLAKNQGYIDKYHIDREAIKVNHVINSCQMDNGGCSHICYYNYLTQLFTCTCPTHLVLDSTGKNCVAWSGSSEDDAVPIPSHASYPGMPYESTSNSAQEFEYSSNLQHGVHFHPESNTEHSSDSEYNKHNDQQHGHPELAAEPTAEPTAEPYPNQEDKSSVNVEDIPEVEESHQGLDNDTHPNGKQSFRLFNETNGGSQVVPESTADPTFDGKFRDYAHSVYESEEPTPEPSLESTASKDSNPAIHSSNDGKAHEVGTVLTSEPAPEPTSEPIPGSGIQDHVVQSVYSSKNFEPTAEPNAKDNAHAVHSVSEFGEQEPKAEPTPVPAVESNARDGVHAVHSMNEFNDYEPAVEPTPEPAPEPTAEPVPGTYDSDHILSVHDPKNQEPAAEPTPEPTAEPNARNKIHTMHSKDDFSDHEAVAEPTPEPAPEPTSEPIPSSDDHDVPSLHDPKNQASAAEPTAEQNPEGKDHTGHSFYESESEDHKPVTETILGSGYQIQEKEHDAHSSKNSEPLAEPTPETTVEDKEREYGGHYIHKTEDFQNATVYTLTNGTQAAEQSPDPAPEPAPEPSADDNHQTSSSNSEDNDHLKATTLLLPSQDHMNLGSDSSLNISNQHPISHEEQMLVKDFKTQYSSGTHPAGQSEPNKENKSGHQIPHLQDILIRTPSSELEKKNTTTHGQEILQGVELTENGEPVIEEVLIDKSGKKGQDEHETSTIATISNSHLDNESDRSNPVTGESSTDPSSAFAVANNNSTNQSIFGNKPSGEPSETKTMRPEFVESASAGPVNDDRSALSQSVLDGKATNNGDFESIDISPDTRQSKITSNNQEPKHHFNAEANHFGVHDTAMPSDRSVEQTHISKNLSQNIMPDSTIEPEIQHEYRPIPVAIEISSSSEKNTSNDEEPKHDSNGESGEPHKTEKTNLGLGEVSTETSRMNSNDDLMLLGGGSDQEKWQEATTESQVATTMMFSVLTPDAVGGKIADRPTDEKEKEAGLRETVFDNGTINDNGHLENNETTKSPEEISNNIKDELTDNEEFNTLLGKEHKKESNSNDAKDLLNKYPNKSQKVEKKKIKDYIKGEKSDSDQKTEVTSKPPVTPEDFILQKHVNGNENTFDLDYSLQNEHTTKHDGEVTIIDPQGFDGVPGVSFKPHGINNHDLRVLQTVATDSTSETGQIHEFDTQAPDFKVKAPDNREGDKQDKDYAKFDKDYKYEKQKVSKKKDLKKKGGSGKDGKNVELDDGRKYFTETAKENPETGHEILKDVNAFEKITTQSETGKRHFSGSMGEATPIPEYKSGIETTFHPRHTNTLEKRTEVIEGVTEYKEQAKSKNEEAAPIGFEKPSVRLQDDDQHRTPVDQNHHQMIEEPSAKTTSSISPGTVYDRQLPASVNPSDSGTIYVTVNSSVPFANTASLGLTTSNSNVTPGTVFDAIPDDTTPQSFASGTGLESSGTHVDGPGFSTSFTIPKIMVNEGSLINTTTANPTIIIHGQSGSLQDGHILRFANATFHNPGNASITPAINGNLNHSDSQTFTFTNYTTTFPNGSVVQPTIIVRGQSGTLQDGHEIRFGNATFVTSSPPKVQSIFKNSTVYRIENGSSPGTVFDGHFNPQNGHYHMFSNSSGTFVYSNVTAQPTFIIKGESGDFGNSRAYIMANRTGSTFSRDFNGPSVIFRNSTVFAVGNDTLSADSQGVTMQPHDVTPNETIQFTRQMSPNFFSTGTAYKVNNYFGYISKCAAGQFQCVNGTSKRGSSCISLSSKCDSINDCSDGSDELGCIENGCPGNFQCSDGSCLKRNLVCNGILDCSDGSDEKLCESWKCEFDEFQCPSGRCIPVVWQCDGKPDCDNHTDEYNCQTSCGNDEYLCPEGWCVPLTYKCNSVKECSLGEDEQLCDCSHEEFKCQTGGCVSMKQICDGLDDCPDRSDEWDCVKLEPGSNLLKIKSASGDFEPVCADDWTSRNSDEVCASLGYYSSVPVETENSSSITTETSFFILKNDSTDNSNKKFIVNLKKSEGDCLSGKLVAVRCQEFSCGSRSMTDGSSVEARLVGGMSATAGQWPSVALLYNTRNFHSCTANVLTPRWVLASYNCLKMGNKNLNEQDWKFFGGSTVFEAERENAETRKIVSVIPHPQVKFNQFLFSNDLALIKLDSSLQFTSNLGAVCLPEQEMQPRQICVTAGWGMDSPEDKTIRQQLQYLPVPTMNLTDCNSTEHYSGFITDDKICAGYNSAQKSLCYNEEGAPLMCVNDRGEWELQGVLSYHADCGRGSHPSIFSSITPVADWIKKTIGNAFERKA